MASVSSSTITRETFWLGHVLGRNHGGNVLVLELHTLAGWNSQTVTAEFSLFCDLLRIDLECVQREVQSLWSQSPHRKDLSTSTVRGVSRLIDCRKFGSCVSSHNFPGFDVLGTLTEQARRDGENWVVLRLQNSCRRQSNFSPPAEPGTATKGHETEAK